MKNKIEETFRNRGDSNLKTFEDYTFEVNNTYCIIKRNCKYHCDFGPAFVVNNSDKYGLVSEIDYVLHGIDYEKQTYLLLIL